MDSSTVSGGGQDGVPPHRRRVVTKRLTELFGDRVIALNRPAEWPPRSSDLTPLDFFFWGHLKSKIFATPPANLHELQQRIVTEVDTLRERALNNMRRRATLSVKRRGGHMEDWVWTYEQKDFLNIKQTLDTLLSDKSIFIRFLMYHLFMLNHLFIWNYPNIMLHERIMKSRNKYFLWPHNKSVLSFFNPQCQRAFCAQINFYMFHKSCSCSVMHEILIKLVIHSHLIHPIHW